MLNLEYMMEYIPEIPDLILFLANDMLIVHIFRYGLTRGTLSSEHVLVLLSY
jgi:hypothetical protein